MNKYLTTILTFFLITHGWSYHLFNRGLNENHNAIGIEYIQDSGLGIGCITYDNSFKDDSTVCAISLRYNQTESITGLVRIGLVAGYDDQIYPIILPGIDIKYEQIYFELSALPNVAILLIKVGF